MKTCGCGVTHDIVAWTALPLVASGVDLAGDGLDIVDMRNCGCGSTLVVDVYDQMVAETYAHRVPS